MKAGVAVLLVVGAALAPADGYREERADGPGYRHVILVPKDAGDRRLPVLVYLHGAIERGDDLANATRTGPPKEVVGGRALPFVVVAPLLPAGEQWSVARLGKLLDAVAARPDVDPKRLVLTGKSLGGAATWEAALAWPERFVAIVPVSAAGDPSRVCALQKVPVRAYHNARDPVVPVARAQAMVTALQGCGGDATLTVFDADGHDAWTAAYGDAALYDWLLAQRR